jgi:glycosyltransferase involved in cell wall biosynthesis
MAETEISKPSTRRVAENIDILLATFNGARFLPEQLESIAAQSHRDWRLIVRDDGSSDDTSAILKGFAESHAERVLVLDDGRGRLGACGNFAALLEASDAPYFMFCDQDDLWLPDKIADLLRTLRAVEERRGGETPILAHSDLIVVDHGLGVLHRSFWRYSRLLDPAAPRRPARLMLQNYVTGCASIGNAALRRAALPIPDEARVHDWWVALVAAVLGEIAEHEAPTILYRQHHGNEIGANPGGLLGMIGRLIRTRGAAVRDVRILLEKSQNQAAALAKAHDLALGTDSGRTLLEFSRLRHSGFWRRKSFLFRADLRPDYWLHSAIFCLLL